MIQHQLGRGGLGSNSGRLCRATALLFVAFALAIAGCSSNKPQQPGAGAGQNGNGLGEGTLGANGQSSLNKFKNGGSLGGEGPLGDIHFAFNDYTISTQDGEVLKSNAKWMQDNPGSRVQIEGHCDDRGSEEYNIALGARRAQAAKDYLETLGIPADRMSTISYGKELPLCTDQDEECWAQNRRDHFVVQGS
ncbi:MAG TPA: peptidoglycan-associated lipoprotein Pal [Candidatus Binataceae bacterium]|nr:peptidoglycan-associated lipoprotein Pal [Candidatus Binataceae bacterium]